MRKIKRDIDLEKIVSTCAWCQKRIPKDSEVFSLGTKVKPEFNLKNQEGGAMQMFLATTGKMVFAIVPTSDSQAKRDGNDLIFMICSQSCGRALKKALQEELDFIDKIIQ